MIKVLIYYLVVILIQPFNALEIEVKNVNEFYFYQGRTSIGNRPGKFKWIWFDNYRIIKWFKKKIKF